MSARHGKILSNLKRLGAPLVLINMVMLTFVHFDCSGKYGFVEYYAGDAAVTKAQQARGIEAQALDIRYDDVGQDMTSDHGFINALACALNIIPGGGSHWGTVCSSWIFMSSGTTKRSKLAPMGDRNCQSVRMGNLMVSRMVLILLVVQAVGAAWFLEQPLTSLMMHHVRMQWLARKVAIFELRPNMCDFGHATKKPTELWSNKPEVVEIKKYATPAKKPKKVVKLVDQYVDKNGRKRVTGGKLLKGSQSYPKGFGEAMASLMATNSSLFKRQGSKPVRDMGPPAGDAWKDAELDGPMKLLVLAKF